VTEVGDRGLFLGAYDKGDFFPIRLYLIKEKAFFRSFSKGRVISFISLKADREGTYFFLR